MTFVVFMKFCQLLYADGTYPGICGGYDTCLTTHPMPCLVKPIVLRNMFIVGTLDDYRHGDFCHMGSVSLVV